MYGRAMNWDDLKLVDAAARMRSLSGAAKSLDISQPQLSRRLKAFEDRIGARLFDRLPSGLKPTEAGSRLIPLADDMRRKAEAAERVLPDLSGSSLKVVRIAVDEVRAKILTDMVPLLNDRLQDIELELISSHNHVDHQSRSIELQIRNCLPETDTLIARKLGDLAYGVYGSRSYVSAHSAALTDARYHMCSWLGFTPDDLWYPAQNQWLRDRLSCPPRLRSNTMTTLMNMIAGGCGLGLLPVFMGDQHPDLVRVMDPLKELTNPEHIVVHRDVRREPAVRLAIDAIAEVYRLMAPRLTGANSSQTIAAAE
jgi:DNA-binding transcriptional LysR family regulator